MVRITIKSGSILDDKDAKILAKALAGSPMIVGKKIGYAGGICPFKIFIDKDEVVFEEISNKPDKDGI